MHAQKWFKFYGQEYLSDPKIERLTPTERSCWITLLCIASLTDGNIRFLTIESLLNKSGIQFDPYHPEEWEKALGVLVKFQNLDMITCKENGDIVVTNWEKRQETNLTGAERVRNFRERQKSTANQGETDGVTHDVTDVTLDKNRLDKNRVDKNSIDTDSAKPEKETYGEMKKVKLTKEEYDKLVERFGEKNTQILIFELDTYVASKGAKYQSHYATLLNWAKRKTMEQHQKQVEKEVGKKKIV